MAEVDSKSDQQTKQVKLSQSEVPSLELERALRVAHILWDQFAGKSARPIQIAEALDIKPSSGGWRQLTGASIAYGLTEGGYNAQDIKLSELGRQIVAPREDGEETSALIAAALTPRVCREFFQKYQGAKFPADKNAISVLYDMGVPKERTDRVVSILKNNGQYVGVLRIIKGETYVEMNNIGQRRTSTPPDQNHIQSDDLAKPAPDEDDDIQPPASPPAPLQQTGPRQLFVAHGKNMQPVNELKKVLDQFKIPYRIAVDEAHSGRPISAKVAELMKSCSAGIFIFTKDEQFTNSKGEEIWRPSENAVYELGAGNILWDQKIIVLKEEGVNFASDYQDIGYITFDSTGLAAKALDLLRELVGLGLVQFQAV